MNCIDKSLVAKIHALSAEGWGVRKIARMLKCTPSTVSRYRGINPTISERVRAARKGAPKPEILDSRAGFCGCGCGLQTTVYLNGPLKGSWRRWVNGHAANAMGPSQ